MATRTWKGKAKAVKQVNTITVALTWAQNDTATVTCDGIDFVVTIGTLVTTDQVATTIKQAYNGETLTDTSASCSPTVAQTGAQAIPQMAEAVATVSGSVVTLTARTAGKPFTFTVTEVTAGSGTATGATSTAATGPNYWDNADNWSADTVPVNSDTVVFNSGNVSCKYNLTTSIQPASFIKTKGYTGQIGLLEINADSTSAPYNEYRTPRALTFNDNSVTCTYDLEFGDGSGSNLIRIDAGAGQSIFNTYGYGTRAITGQPTTLLTGTHASNVLNCQQGDFAVGFFQGDTSQLATVRCGNGTTSGATGFLGSGVTLTSATIDVCGGNLTINSATASADIDISGGGTVTINGTGAQNNIDVQNGTCNYRTTGTLTTLAVRSGGTFDKTSDLRACTVTTTNVYKGATVKDHNKSVTWTNGIVVNGCKVSEVTLDLGTDRTLTIA